jgi:Prenyltransferase and squalene oxidase repeat
MGLKLGVLVAAGVVAGTPVSYVTSHQQPDGGFAEPRGRSNPGLTAWAVLGLAASGKPPAHAAEYLAGKPIGDATDLALRILALRALDAQVGPLVDRLDSLRRRDGRIGPLVNSTIWGTIALRSVGRLVGSATIRYLLRQQRAGGGWAWYQGGAPDSNDTATAIEALSAAGVDGRPVRRGLAYLRRLQRADGGFSLVKGRASDSQSTGWAIQAFLAAGKRPPARAFAYLARMRRRDGSYRYSARYAVTPVWVTAQVLPALARQPFPLR